MFRPALLLAAASLAACAPDLEALTTAPPGATAELDADDEEIRLTRGAALGVACTDGGNLCGNMVVTVADPTIADARVAFRDLLELDWNDGAQAATSFIIFGKRTGETRVTVDSSEGAVSYDVVVRDP
jgi:hypothetical protein